MQINLNNLINLRGHRQQFHSFFGHNLKGGMKNIMKQGSFINVPLRYSLNGHEIQNEILYEKIRIGEESPMLNIGDLVNNTVFSRE